MGEKTAALFTILSRQVSPLAAAAFLAAIKDPAVDTETLEAAVGWKYVKAAYNEVLDDWDDLNEKLYNVDEAHVLVSFRPSRVFWDHPPSFP